MAQQLVQTQQQKQVQQQRLTQQQLHKTFVAHAYHPFKYAILTIALVSTKATAAMLNTMKAAFP